MSDVFCVCVCVCGWKEVSKYILAIIYSSVSIISTHVVELFVLLLLPAVAVAAAAAAVGNTVVVVVVVVGRM